MFFKVRNSDNIIIEFSNESFGSITSEYFEVEFDFKIPPGQPPYFYKWNGSKIIENDDENLLDQIRLELTSLHDDFKVTATPILDQSRYNNYDITGLESCDVLDIDCNRNIDLTGLKYGWEGRRMVIRNISANRRIRLRKNSSYSDIKNRFFVRYNYSLNYQSAIELIYINGYWTILKD